MVDSRWVIYGSKHVEVPANLYMVIPGPAIEFPVIPGLKIAKTLAIINKIIPA